MWFTHLFTPVQWCLSQGSLTFRPRFQSLRLIKVTYQKVKSLQPLRRLALGALGFEVRAECAKRRDGIRLSVSQRWSGKHNIDAALTRRVPREERKLTCLKFRSEPKFRQSDKIFKAACAHKTIIKRHAFHAFVADKHQVTYWVVVNNFLSITPRFLDSLFIDWRENYITLHYIIWCSHNCRCYEIVE